MLKAQNFELEAGGHKEEKGCRFGRKSGADRSSYRPTWAEIDLGAIRHNLRRIKELLDPEVYVMGVVKANAYGHGIERVGRTLADEGIDYLGVASVDEALKLRNSGIKEPILVLGSMLEDEALAAMQHDVTLTLCDRRLLEILVKLARQFSIYPKVHVKVDTGMGRIGVWHEEAVDFIKEAHSRKEIQLEGVYTHFCSAGRDKVITTFQIEAFEKILGEIEASGVKVKYKHAANSIAVVDWKKSHMNLVRPGILLYGVYPKESFRKDFTLSPAMALRTKIVYLKDAPAGRSISYGRTYITQKNTKIATIPIGYGDGYGRILSNKAEALVNGQFVRIAGIVTMDQTLLDVGHIQDVKVGDEVVLIGRQGDSEILVEKVAKLSGTIPYEIIATITERVPRMYNE